MMRITGRVHRFGDHVNTDVIIPGRYLTLRTKAELGRHCMEGLDPEFAGRAKPGDILVAGRNFGSGSSREHAILSLQGAGIAAVVVESAARIFFRNAINLALPVIVCAEAARALQEGEEATIEPVTGLIAQAGRAWQAPPFQGEVAAILASGGLVEYLRRSFSPPPILQD
ncbi:3-isopropylmalate dehydratase small subunit [Falsiroseomonas sp. HC035]|uniref:LeuD/DmdB family oxidoreductase small subunit n=1 Tax=Falsiroseomonas sp. HC035 TaxID=3390999 RepID=UPI003D31C347